MLLALILLALLAPALIGALKGRHIKAIELSQKVDTIRQFDRKKMDILERITPAELDQLEERGSIDFLGAQLKLKKNKIRSDGKKRTYLVECRAHGQKDLILFSQKEKRETQPEHTPHRQEEESRDSSQQGAQQSKVQ